PRTGEPDQADGPCRPERGERRRLCPRSGASWTRPRRCRIGGPGARAISDSQGGTPMSEYTGVAVSPGRVVGEVLTMAPPVAEPPAGQAIPEGADAAAESARIPVAAASVQAQLERR